MDPARCAAIAARAPIPTNRAGRRRAVRTTMPLRTPEDGSRRDRESLLSRGRSGNDEETTTHTRKSSATWSLRRCASTTYFRSTAPSPVHGTPTDARTKPRSRALGDSNRQISRRGCDVNDGPMSAENDAGHRATVAASHGCARRVGGRARVCDDLCARAGATFLTAARRHHRPTAMEDAEDRTPSGASGRSSQPDVK